MDIHIYTKHCNSHKQELKLSKWSSIALLQVVLTQIVMVLVYSSFCETQCCVCNGQRKCKGSMSVGRGLAIILFSAAIISQVIVLKKVRLLL